ncbi:MAG TPA: winged helix-turn-helix domain-containing protein [Candidatus Acidoferrales bacterium]|jgi:DNA-binding winged helix-turn-helix (wHTH) protein/Tol biopolymer transport system component|nr:winged helix-turn-helix domain-containing protein [Candidatus Acidoferrales bacterium]
MTNGSRTVFEFGPFRIDPSERLLTRAGTVIPLPPKAFDTLLYLVRSSGHLLGKEELIKAIWQDTFVEESSLAQSISVLRKALGERPEQREYIETAPRLGYRFIAAVEEKPVPDPSPPEDRESSQVKIQREPLISKGIRARWVWLAASLTVVLASIGIFEASRRPPKRLTYTQLTSFTESAVAPALSPDGRMLAFIRGEQAYLSTDQIYVKWLPDGEPVQLTHDSRPKFSPAFTPDGSRVAFTLVEPTRSEYNTYTVPVLGAEPQLLFHNAEGLTWIGDHRILFSEIKTGLHMAVATATSSRSESRDVYVPEHERAMAHFSHASPDGQWALVVWKDQDRVWQPCLLVPMNGSSTGRPVGPQGSCMSAAWSPDRRWMYFSVKVDGGQHLWRQRFPNGPVEQITFGPNEEDGIAMAPDGHSLITSVGSRQTAVWVHDAEGEHAISFDGETWQPRFSADGSRLYYLLRRSSEAAPGELWTLEIASAKSDRVLPGFSVQEYDISGDDREVVFSTAPYGATSRLFLAPLDRRSPPVKIASFVANAPHFGPEGDLIFLVSEGKGNYLFRMSRDGSSYAKLVPYPVSSVQGISPGRHWVMALSPVPGGHGIEAVLAVPTAGGGSPVRVCSGYCVVSWAPDGKLLYVVVEQGSNSHPGKVAALRVAKGTSLPRLPASGLHSMDEATAWSGKQVFVNSSFSGSNFVRFAPGPNPSVFAFERITVHRNLFRISLP